MFKIQKWYAARKARRRITDLTIPLLIPVHQRSELAEEILAHFYDLDYALVLRLIHRLSHLDNVNIFRASDVLHRAVCTIKSNDIQKMKLLALMSRMMLEDTKYVDTFRGFLWTYIGWTQCALIRSYASVVYVETAFGSPCTFTEAEKRRMQLDLDRLTMFTSWCYDVTKDNTITRIS